MAVGLDGMSGLMHDVVQTFFRTRRMLYLYGKGVNKQDAYQEGEVGAGPPSR